MRKLAKLNAMSGQERRWLLQAWMLLPVVKVLLWQIGYRRTFANLERWLRLQSGDVNIADHEKQQQAILLGRLVNMAANHSPFVINCLPRSLVLWGMLRRAGLAADLRIGVQTAAEGFMAHAWIEYCGQAVSEDRKMMVDYSPFADLIGGPEKSRAL